MPQLCRGIYKLPLHNAFNEMHIAYIIYISKKASIMDPQTIQEGISKDRKGNVPIFKWISFTGKFLLSISF